MPVLVVQMGHSGRTSGATGAPGEMAFTEAVGGACARLLARGGWTVRPIVADPPSSQYRGDAFVAVHADGSTNPAVRGASVGYQTPEGADLAHAWRDAYVRRGFSGPWHPDNYTVNLAQYYGVRAAAAQGNGRACIIECGTITNAEDRTLMDPDRVALAIGEALGIVDQEEGMAAVDWDVRYTFGRLGVTTEFGNWVGETNVNSAEAANAAKRCEALLAAVIANQQDDLTSDEVIDRVDRSVREATDKAVHDVVLPALARIEAALEADDAAQARAVVDELSARLSAAAGS